MNFHEAILHDLRANKRQCERAIEQLGDGDLHWQADPEANSIAIIMKHMVGNMLSRWTNFLTTDGEKPDRNRDSEFVDQFTSRAELMVFWDRGWACAFNAIEPLTEADMSRTVTIRGEALTVAAALVRQLSHYSQHTGQIIFIAKHLCGSEWKTLSMPRKK
jgi:hypothetical protein